MRLAPLLILPVILTLACREKSAAPDASVPDAQPAVTQTSTAPAPNLAERLQREAANRPAGTPKVEEVHEALRAAGIDLKPLRQTLALTVEASYCTISGSPSGLGVAICEYADEAAAERGRALSLDRLKAVPNREIFVNRKTTLTLRNTPNDDVVRAEIKKAHEVFSKL